MEDCTYIIHDCQFLFLRPSLITKHRVGTVLAEARPYRPFRTRFFCFPFRLFSKTDGNSNFSVKTLFCCVMLMAMSVLSMLTTSIPNPIICVVYFLDDNGIALHVAICCHLMIHICSIPYSQLSTLLEIAPKVVHRDL
ncbi:unnamed protein product [Albugo candida]|uniref:Uncharacterized protein n=1 Tax=Albugo candida TaxID=65357 RepID=A0A024GAA1_9STRA|nr:unnamed protein product [Albugo candida]|eukprot:CCI43791.1 unnamed protein product [Albugo candida]